MKMKQSTTKRLSFLLALAMTISLTACGGTGNKPSDPQLASSASSSAPESIAPTEDTSEPESQPNEPANSVTITDQAGREVVIEGTVNNIVSGYYISSSAGIALGLTDKLVGIEAKAASRPIYTMAAPQLLELPNVGTAKEFNLEGCIALEPDLVILPKRLKDSAETMAELGIPVLLVNPESHEGLVEMIVLIGKATGTEEQADKLIAYYEDELSAVEAIKKDITEKPVVYMAGNAAYLFTAPKDMYQSSLIETAGGINAAAEIDGDSWTDVSYEQIVAMNPDVIVIPAEASYSKDDVLGDAQLSDITAIKEGRVYQMPTDFEAWDSPVPSATLGVRWLLSVLHEDIYPLETLQADAAHFYREFYGIEIDTALVGK